MLSANAFIFDWSKILLFGKELRRGCVSEQLSLKAVTRFIQVVSHTGLTRYSIDTHFNALTTDSF